MAPGWTAACVALRSGRVRDQETGELVATTAEAAHSSSRPPTQDGFFSVEWRAAQAEPDSNVPFEAALLWALNLGSTAWQDSRSLQWPVYLAHKQVIPGRVSVEIDALTLGH